MRQLSLAMIIAGCCSAGAVLCGCAGGSVSFDSPDSADRLRAIHRAAADDDRTSIPKLIEMLESDDSAIRLLSIRTLESMTGQTLGYDPIAPEYERTPAVERWQQWYGDQTGSSAERSTDKATTSAGSTSGVSSAPDPALPENRNTGKTPTSAHHSGMSRVALPGEAGAKE